jgi:hypothetical protein
MKWGEAYAIRGENKKYLVLRKLLNEELHKTMKWEGRHMQYVEKIKILRKLLNEELHKTMKWGEAYAIRGENKKYLENLGKKI